MECRDLSHKQARKELSKALTLNLTLPLQMDPCNSLECQEKQNF